MAAPSVERLVQLAGTTYCEQAGFTLRDKPAPLYQLTTLTILLAKPIDSDMAVDACRELRRAGGRTPDGMRKLTWQERVDALGRAHYRRFDESTATILGKAVDTLEQDYGKDLRRLASAAGEDVQRAERLLVELPGIGPAGAGIFLREVQRVWTWAQPYLDDRALQGAQRLGWPHSRKALIARLDGADVAAAAAALVRVTIDDALADRLTS